MVKILVLVSLALACTCLGSPNIGRSNNVVSNLLDCITDCPTKTGEYNPMCGSDGVDYWNMSYLRCAQRCGVDVYPTHPAPCHKVTPRITRKNDVQQCMQECPRTSEYNPICGSDGVLYFNPGHLTCAQWCGIDVTALHPPPCNRKN